MFFTSTKLIIIVNNNAHSANSNWHAVTYICLSVAVLGGKFLFLTCMDQQVLPFTISLKHSQYCILLSQEAKCGRKDVTEHDCLNVVLSTAEKVYVHSDDQHISC